MKITELFKQDARNRSSLCIYDVCNSVLTSKVKNILIKFTISEYDFYTSDFPVFVSQQGKELLLYVK